MFDLMRPMAVHAMMEVEEDAMAEVVDAMEVRVDAMGVGADAMAAVHLPPV